jgi:hypothetical protein
MGGLDLMLGWSWVSWVFTCQGELDELDFMVGWSSMSWLFTWLEELCELYFHLPGRAGVAGFSGGVKLDELDLCLPAGSG